MTITHTNGTPQQRKTLASQLDRLDSILDALSDGLNEAVAHTVEQAVGTAVRGAVQGVLTELLSNPVVLARLREALAPTAPVATQPPVAPAASVPTPMPQKSRLKGHCERAKSWLKCGWDKTRAAFRAGVDCLKTGMQKAKECWRRAQPYRAPLLLAAGVGLVFGVVGYFAGPWFAAGAAWLAGFVTTLGIQAGLAFRRLMGLGVSA